MIQQFINALSLGSIYALLALGLAVVFSVLGLLNFAFGEIVTTTSYSVIFALSAGWPLWLAALIGLVVGIATSLLTELLAFRPLRGSPAYAVIFSSFAVATIIQAVIRNYISPRPQGAQFPSWVDSSINIAGTKLPILPLLTLIITIVALSVLLVVLNNSKHGIAMRAAAEDFTTARLMGAKADNLIRFAFIVSGALAAIAGILWVARVGSASPGMGFNPLLQAFIAVVLGGIGNLRGAVIGGFCLGILEVGLQVVLPRGLAPYVEAITLVAIFVLLYLRPTGLTKKVEERLA